MPADWLYILFGFILFVANVTAWSGTFYRLPGNWIIVANCTLYLAFFPAKPNGAGFTWFLIVFLLALAALGDSLSFATKRFRILPQRERIPGMRKVILGAGSGSLAGALLGMSIPIVGVLMAIVGSVGGAAGGAYVGALLAGRPNDIKRSEENSASLSNPPTPRINLSTLLRIIRPGRSPQSPSRFFHVSDETIKIIPRLLLGGMMVLIVAFHTIVG